MFDVLEPYRLQFEAVKAQIEAADASGRWRVRVFYFMDPANPNGIGIQLARDTWYNEDGEGIHFETWVTAKEMVKPQLPFKMHVLHQDFFPGTAIKAWAMILPFLEDPEVIAYVADWKGFKLGRVTPLKGALRFKGETTAVILDAFTRYQALGDAVDRALAKALASA